MADLIKLAFDLLYPDKEFSFTPNLNYSAKFKGYNANVRLIRNNLIFNLSKKWKSVSPDIQIGLIQELMVKLFKNKAQTVNMDLYSYFMRNLPSTILQKHSHPVLEDSFKRVNINLFQGLLDIPNLKLCDSFRKLGCYEYGTDTISITKYLLDDIEALDYVMFHEMLHKKFKYKSNCGRHHYHTKEFRDMEKSFPNADLIEKRLNKLSFTKAKQSVFALFKW